jgi:hypothetical protein
MAHRRWIKQRLLAHGRPAILFAGSSHRWSRNSCANVGEIFIADLNARNELKVRYQSYEKRVAAKGLGEALTQMPKATLPYFGTSLGKVAVLICIDAFDPGVIMSIFASSRGINRVGMILVPAYNPSQRLVRSCQHLSYIANCAVVYVNAMATAPHEKAQVFISGISLPTWRAQFRDVVKMINEQVKLDARMVESIPGVRNLRRLVHLADIGRHVDIQRIGPGQQLMKWIIPHGFPSEAAAIMTEKYPYVRGRLIANLAVEDA